LDAAAELFGLAALAFGVEAALLGATGGLGGAAGGRWRGEELADAEGQSLARGDAVAMLGTLLVGDDEERPRGAGQEAGELAFVQGG